MAESKLDIRLAVQGAEQAENAFARINNSLKAMGDSAAGKSMRGLNELLRGGGVAAGIDLMGRWALSAANLSEEFQKGEKSFGEIIEGVAKSLPIFGNLIAAGRKFREVIDGTAAEIRNIEADAARGNALADYYQEATRRAKEFIQAAEDASRKGDREVLLAGASPEERARLSMGFKAEDDAASISRRAAAEIAAVEAAFAKAKQKLKDDLEKAQKEVPAAAAGGGKFVMSGDSMGGMTFVDPAVATAARDRVNSITADMARIEADREKRLRELRLLEQAQLGEASYRADNLRAIAEREENRRITADALAAKEKVEEEETARIRDLYEADERAAAGKPKVIVVAPEAATPRRFADSQEYSSGFAGASIAERERRQLEADRENAKGDEALQHNAEATAKATQELVRIAQEQVRKLTELVGKIVTPAVASL